MLPKMRQPACRPPPHGDQRAQSVTRRAGERRPARSRLMAATHQTAAAPQHGARLGWCGEFCKRWQSGMTRGYPIIRGRDHGTGFAAGVMLTAFCGVVPGPIMYARVFTHCTIVQRLAGDCHHGGSSCVPGRHCKPWGSVVGFTSSVVTSSGSRVRCGLLAGVRQAFGPQVDGC